MDARDSKIIDDIKDPAMLRALLKQATEYIGQQNKLIKEIQEENANKLQQGFILEERVKLMRRQLFGRSKEDRPEASDRPRDKSQEEALLFSQAAFPSEGLRTDKKGKARGWDLEAVVVDHHMTDRELEAESELRGIQNASADQWTETGLYDESTKI